MEPDLHNYEVVSLHGARTWNNMQVTDAPDKNLLCFESILRLSSPENVCKM